MADRKTLEALLERVQGASGMDRELDLALGLSLDGWARVGKDYTTPDPNGELVRDSGGDVSVAVSGGMYPSPTGSVDEALSLVERLLPGTAWGIDKTDEGDPSEWYDATVGEGFAQAESAPLALLAAALRALIAESAS